MRNRLQEDNTVFFYKTHYGISIENEDVNKVSIHGLSQNAIMTLLARINECLYYYDLDSPDLSGMYKEKIQFDVHHFNFTLHVIIYPHPNHSIFLSTKIDPNSQAEYSLAKVLTAGIEMNSPIEFSLNMSDKEFISLIAFVANEFSKMDAMPELDL